MSLRAVKQILEAKPAIEGAGVKLQRAFGFASETLPALSSTTAASVGIQKLRERIGDLVLRALRSVSP